MRSLVKGAIIFLVMYIFVVLQSSFLSYFSLYGFVPNFVLIFSIIWVLFERPNYNFGVFVAFSAGLFFDIFFSPILGYNILIFSISAIALKYILRNYVRIPLTERS